MGTELHWQPLVNVLTGQSACLTDIICPFIQSASLEHLLGNASISPTLRVLTRWNREDLISGVSDREAYPILEARGAPLFIHPELHAKVFCFDDGRALAGSGNLTNAGLGLGDDINIEAAAFSACDSRNDAQITALFAASTRVTDTIYTLAGEVTRAHATGNNSFDEEESMYSLPSPEDLPMSANPARLWTIYTATSLECAMHDEETAASWRDILFYRVPFGISHQQEFEAQLKLGFLARPAVAKIIEFIRDNTPAGMPAFNPRYEGVQNGAIRSFLADSYGVTKRSIADRVNNLQAWLPFCKPEVSVDVDTPGRGISRVFYWRAHGGRD